MSDGRISTLRSGHRVPSHVLHSVVPTEMKMRVVGKHVEKLAQHVRVLELQRELEMALKAAATAEAQVAEVKAQFVTSLNLAAQAAAESLRNSNTRIGKLETLYKEAKMEVLMVQGCVSERDVGSGARRGLSLTTLHCSSASRRGRDERLAEVVERVNELEIELENAKRCPCHVTTVQKRVWRA